MNKIKLVRTVGMTIFIQLLFVTFVIGQDITVQGTVKDAFLKPLAGVSIKVKGGTAEALTDQDGNYSITVPSKGKLLFSAKGYSSATEKVSGKTTLNVFMVPAGIGQDEEVNIGYGTVKKNDLLQSVSSVDKKDIAASSQSDIIQLLKGVPGLVVNDNNGTPEIRIRGTRSFNATNAPLIIVDDMPFNGQLTELNKNDIKSIDVLKDASATSIYGARGANGVILINLKK